MHYKCNIQAILVLNLLCRCFKDEEQGLEARKLEQKIEAVELEKCPENCLPNRNLIKKIILFCLWRNAAVQWEVGPTPRQQNQQASISVIDERI